MKTFIEFVLVVLGCWKMWELWGTRKRDLEDRNRHCPCTECRAKYAHHDHHHHDP